MANPPEPTVRWHDEDDGPAAAAGAARPGIEPGMRLGKYTLRYLIGRGGMAEVWAADEMGPGGYRNPVALKLTLDTLAAHPDALALFLQEAVTATALRHGNLVSTFTFDRAGDEAHAALRGRHYIVMERVEGTDLSRMMAALQDQGYSCPQRIAIFVIGEVLNGLSYIHDRRDTNSLEMRLVHRDISPQNVLVTYSGEVKVSDFGVAKSMRSHTGSIRGKLSYFAPEILMGRPPSPLSDQFAAGVVLWEMLAGRPLFNGRDDQQVIIDVLQCQVPAIDRDIEPTLDAVMRRMLAKEPENRFPSCDAVLEAIYALPGYRPGGGALGKLLASLLPDRDKRWTPDVDARVLLDQMTNAVGRTEEYPDVMEPSLAVVFDPTTNDAVPVSSWFIGQPPFAALTGEAWASWWRSTGINRDAEIYGDGAAVETQSVPHPIR